MLLSQYWSLLKVNNMRELRGVGKGLTVWCMAGFWVSSKAKSKPVKQYRHVNGSSLCDTNTQTEQWKISFCFYTTFLWRLSPSSPPPPHLPTSTMTLRFLCFLCSKKTCSHLLLFKTGHIFSGYEIGHRLCDLVETRRVTHDHRGTHISKLPFQLPFNY